MQNNICHRRQSKNNTLTRKQVNKHDTNTVTQCKHNAVSVCATAELWAAELRTCAQLLSLRCQWASPGWDPPRGLHWEAYTQADIWTALEVISPLCFLTSRLFFSITPSISVSVSPTLSFLFSLPPWRSPQVTFIGERMMNSSTTEPANSSSTMSPCSFHPLHSHLLLFLLPPRTYRVHLFLHFSLAMLHEGGSWGTASHVQRRTSMNGDTSQQPVGH